MQGAGIGVQVFHRNHFRVHKVELFVIGEGFTFIFAFTCCLLSFLEESTDLACQTVFPEFLDLYFRSRKRLGDLFVSDVGLHGVVKLKISQAEFGVIRDTQHHLLIASDDAGFHGVWQLLDGDAVVGRGYRCILVDFRFV